MKQQINSVTGWHPMASNLGASRLKALERYNLPSGPSSYFTVSLALLLIMFVKCGQPQQVHILGQFTALTDCNKFLWEMEDQQAFLHMRGQY
jgi:hypothetical protein